MGNKDRLTGKSPANLTEIERTLCRVEKSDSSSKIDIFSAVAMLWDVANRVTKVHGFNGGTLEDQVKIVMLNAYNHKGKSELTIVEILDLWNYRKHGQAHTRQQVQSAIHALKSKGVVVTVSQLKREGKGGTAPVTYGLSSVIEKLTSPEELEIKPAIAADGSWARVLSPEEVTMLTQNDPDAKLPVGIILTKLVELNEQLGRHFTAIGDALALSDVSNTQMRDAYNKLVTKIHDIMSQYAEIHTHNQEANNANGEQFSIFVDNTNKNFLEIQNYFTSVETTLNHLKTDGINANFDNRYYEHQISQAYRDGYKEGFKDGRKDYKEELATSYRPEVEG